VIENIQQLLKLGGNALKNFLLCLYEVVISPKAFFSNLPDDREQQFVQASIFACFISVLNLVIALPVQRILGIRAESTSYLLVDTVLTYGCWFIMGSIFHASARLVGGHARYLSSVTAFLYLTAYQPLGALVSLPVIVITERQVLEEGYPFTYEQRLRMVRTIIDKPGAVVSLFASVCVLIYLLVAAATAFRVVHRVGRFRGFCILLLGTAGVFVFVSLLEIPLMQLFAQAFKMKP
jgi:Yip1 domain